MDELNIKPLGSENPNPQVPNVTPETTPAVSSTPVAPTAFSLDSIGSMNQQQTTAPAVETAQPSTTEKVQLPTTEASLSGAAMSSTGTTDTTVPKKSSLLKTGLIVAGVVVVVGAAVAAVFWGKGWPFKGDIIAVNEATRFAALQLCPDDQYQPKQSDTTLQLLKGSLVQANAQSLIPTAGLKTINTRTLAPVTNVTAPIVNQDMVPSETADTSTAMVNSAAQADTSTAMVNSAAQADTSTAMVNSAAQADTSTAMVNVDQATKANTTNSISTNTAQTNTSKTANELSVSAVESTLQPAAGNNTDTNGSTGMMVPPAERTGGLTINQNATQQSTCQDIPHGNLVPGDRECKMIDALYADPTGYLINDLTKSHLEEWYKVCHPTPVEVQCRANEELSKETNECVCKAGYFDISADIPASTAAKSDTAILSLANTDSTLSLANTDSANTATLAGSPTASRLSTNTTAVNTDSISSLRLNTNTSTGGKCMNCDDIAKYIERYEAELAATTDEATKAGLQERLDLLNKIAEKHGCKKTEVKCVDGQVLTSDGTCECPANTNFNESTQKCEFDCARVVKSIVSMRESATKTPETQNQLDELIKIAKENQCDVPEEKTTCQTYQDDAEKALSEKNYDAYISASMKLLSADCGREVNSCERTLAEASLVKRTLTQVAGNADLEEKYKSRLEELKAEYYANPECRDDNRCSEIDGTQPTGEVVGAAPTRIANTDSILKLATADATPTTAGAAPTTASPANLETASALRVNNIATFEKVGVLKLTPGSIFEDDKEYYEKNCKKVDLTCDDLLKRYNLSSTTPSANIDLLDVSDEVRQQILRCMPTVPTERIVPQNPKISCEPSSRNVTTGKEVTWTATVEGASNRDNIITYSWSGDATGTGESVKSTYNTAGEKTVVVVATGAGEQAIRATCSTTVSPISPANPPTNPPAIDPASNPPTPSPSPTPTPSPSPAVAPAIAPPTPPSPVSSPTPSPSSASAPIVKVPTPTAPAVAPAKPSSPISSPTPAPSTPVSLPITTPSAPVVATTSTPKVVSPAAPSAPTIHSSAPVTVVTPATPVTPSKEIPPTITPTGPEVYIYLIGFVVGQLYFFRRKVFGLVRNK